MTDTKPYRHGFPMSIIQHAVWLYHRFPLSSRDVQELLYQRGIQLIRETLREWYLAPVSTSSICVRATRVTATDQSGACRRLSIPAVF